MAGKANLILPDWKSAVVPGLYFLTIEPALAVYGRILQLHREGYIWAFCHHHLCLSGEESKLHRDDLTALLSVRQYTFAKSLRWPSTEDGLTQILNLPPD